MKMEYYTNFGLLPWTLSVRKGNAFFACLSHYVLGFCGRQPLRSTSMSLPPGIPTLVQSPPTLLQGWFV